MVPPNPPQSPAQRRSTVSTINEIYPGDAGHPAGHYGLGVRVPMLVASPWSKGGYVNSQVFDHTSLIHFIEARYAHDYPVLIEKNITPWRRAVAGDLTSAFDFRKPNAAIVPLPNTAVYQPPAYEFHSNDAITPSANQAVHGPNGFFRSFRGGISGRSSAVLEVACDYAQDDDEIALAIANRAVRAGEIHVTDRYSGETFQTLLTPRKKLSKKWQSLRHYGWYDFVITVEHDAEFEYRLAGHVENGRDSITDPLIGRVTTR